MPISQDRKVITLKYASKSFGKMSDEERCLHAFDLLLKIHVIVGWTIPVGQLMDILTAQFEKKLSESYTNVNAEEFEYAFRNRNLETNDWGKALNLTMIDEVMLPYLSTRFDLSRQEESLMSKNYHLVEEKRELSDEEKSEWIMDWKSMEDINIDLIPLIFYEFLDTKGIIKIPTEKKWEYTAKGVQYVKAKLQDEIGICKTNDAYIAYNRFQNQEEKGFDKEFAGRIKNRAKRLIVYDYLKDNL